MKKGSLNVCKEEKYINEIYQLNDQLFKTKKLLLKEATKNELLHNKLSEIQLLVKEKSEYLSKYKEKYKILKHSNLEILNKYRNMNVQLTSYINNYRKDLNKQYKISVCNIYPLKRRLVLERREVSAIFPQINEISKNGLITPKSLFDSYDSSIQFCSDNEASPLKLNIESETVNFALESNGKDKLLEILKIKQQLFSELQQKYDRLISQYKIKEISNSERILVNSYLPNIIIDAEYEIKEIKDSSNIIMQQSKIIQEFLLEIETTYSLQNSLNFNSEINSSSKKLDDINQDYDNFYKEVKKLNSDIDKLLN